MNTDGTVLRRRAVELRRVAIRLDQVRLDDVLSLAGSDTWLGPTADACRHCLVNAADMVGRVTATLQADAVWLERRADELDALSLTVV